VPRLTLTDAADDTSTDWVFTYLAIRSFAGHGRLSCLLEDSWDIAGCAVA